MEILKHGNQEVSEEIRIFRCPHCGCVFKANKDEYKSYYPKDKFWELFYYSSCPECGSAARESSE